jgi:RNA recognition motif-containing protein
MKIFIGSLSYNVTEEDLRHAFEAFGQVASATVISVDRRGSDRGGRGDRCGRVRY